MTYVGPSDHDLSYLDQLKTARTASRSATTSAAQNISLLSRIYPGISPGLAYALASSGFGPGDMATSAWQAELSSAISKPEVGQSATVNGGTTDGIDYWDTIQKAGGLNSKLPFDPKGRQAFSEGFLTELAGMTDDEIRTKAKELGLPKNHPNPDVYDEQMLIKGAAFQRKNPNYVEQAAKANASIPLPVKAVGEALDATKVGVRWGFAGLQAPLELTQAYMKQRAIEGSAGDTGFGGVVPEVMDADVKTTQPTWGSYANQTVLGQAIQGESLGEGFLPSPSSQAWQAQAKAARENSPYLIGGHAWTPGRALANTVFEPDTIPFDLASGTVDAAVAIKSDPSIYALKAVGEARKAAAIVRPDEYARAGALQGWSKLFSPKAWSTFVKEEETLHTFTAMAGRDPWEIRQLTGGKIPTFLSDGTPIMAQLGDAKTQQQVADVFYARIGQGIEAKDIMSGPRKLDFRWNYDTPNGKVYFGPHADLNSTAEEIDKVLVNARVGEDTRHAIYNKIAYSGNSIDQQQEVASAVFDALAAQYRAAGWPDDVVRAARTQFEKDWGQLDKVVIDDIKGTVRGPKTNFVMVDGQGHTLPYDGDMRVLTQYEVQMPDFRQVARDTSDWNNMWNNPWVRGTVTGADALNSIWKRVTLARVATAVRIVGEEQMRIASQGYASLFHHPLTAISYAIGQTDHEWLNKFGSALPERLTPNMLKGGSRGYPLGGLFADDDEMRQAMYNRFDITKDHAARQRLWMWDSVAPGAKGSSVGLAEELIRARESKIVRSLLENGYDNTRQAMLAGELSDLPARNPMAVGEAQLTFGTSAVDAELDAASKVIDNVVGARRKADAGYTLGIQGEGVRQDVYERNTALIDAILTGEINGKPLMNSTGRITRSARKQIDDIFKDSTQIVPEKIRVRSLVENDPGAIAASLNKLDDTFNVLMDSLLTRPSNFFSRNVHLQQSFVDAMRDGMMWLDEADRRRVLAMLGSANLPVNKAEEFSVLHGRLTARELELAAKYPTGEEKAIKTTLLDDVGQPKPVYRSPATKDTEATIHEAASKTPLGKVYHSDTPFYKGQKPEYLDVRKMKELPERPKSLAEAVKDARAEGYDAISYPTKSGTQYRITRRSQISADVEGLQKSTSVRFKGAGSYPTAEEAMPKLTFDQVVRVAKTKAVNDTKALLYDLSKRSQLFDSLRIVFPFGEAWKEIMGTWVGPNGILWKDPYTIRRGQTMVQAAQQSGSGVINQLAGMPRDPNSGFFFKDDHGEQWYGYPLSGQLNGLLSQGLFGSNIPIPSVGRVSGLNIIGNGLPGVGPILQIPLAAIMSSSNTPDAIRHLVFPYGEQQGLQSLFPGWVNKIFNAFDDPQTNRIAASSMMDTATWLYSSGNYKTYGDGQQAQDEINRLLHDAEEGSRMLQIVRGFGQFGLPSSPKPEWLTIDKQGRLTLLSVMSKWYEEKRADNKLTPVEKAEAFLEKFGTKNILVTQDKSKSQIPASPVKLETWDWVQEHPSEVKKYPHVFSLFAPQGGEFSQEAYEASFQRGDRKKYTPEEMVRLANGRLANISYEKVKTQLEKDGKLSKQDEMALRDLRTRLVTEFPGYHEDPIPFTEPDVLMAEIHKAALDPTLKNTPAGKALTTYLEQRDNAVNLTNQAGITLTNQRAARLNQKLVDWGEYLVDKYPAFQPMWDTVLKPELTRG